MTVALQAIDAAEGGGDVFLDAYLAPFREWLDREDVTELLINRPGEMWVEAAGLPAMQRVASA